MSHTLHLHISDDVHQKLAKRATETGRSPATIAAQWLTSVARAEKLIPLQSDVKQLLDDLKQRLQALYGERLVDVMLFGSVVRGEDTPHSDVDVLVRLRGPVDRHKENKRMADIVVDLMAKHHHYVEPVAIDEKTFQSGNWPFLANAREEGVSL